MKTHAKKLILCLLLGLFATTQMAIAQNGDKKNATEITDATFNQSTQKGIVVVDFWATWCRPCLTQAPIFEDAATAMVKNKVKFYKLDVDKNKQAASRYQVRNIPTIIIFKNGKEVKRLVGLQTKDVLVQEIENQL